MPYNDKEKQREAQRKYRAKNRERDKEYSKRYYQEHKQQKREYGIEYRKTHKTEALERIKKWNKTENGKKSKRIKTWKNYGIIHDDYDALYDKYLNTNNCEECGIQMCFGISGEARCLDHDHETGLVRNIICRSCNVRRR